MSHKETFQCNLATLANATELASKVIQRIAGEEIANTVDGKVLVAGELREAIAAKLQGCLLTSDGSKSQ